MSQPILTERDDKMLALLAKGFSVRAVADAVGLSYGTTRVYLCNLYGRLGVGNKTQAALWYVQREHRAKARAGRSVACLEDRKRLNAPGLATRNACL
jgi:DNA-binding CsgD family transcriptional regulator